MTGRRLKPIRPATAAAISGPETAPVFEAARSALLDSAKGGNLRAIELLARGALDALSSPEDLDPLAAHVAAAMIAAGLVADQIGPERTAEWLDGFPRLKPADRPMDMGP